MSQKQLLWHYRRQRRWLRRVGTGTGYGDWVGRAGVVPTDQARCSRSKPDSEAGPGTPLQGEWSGWSGAADVQAPRPPLPAVGPAPLSGTLPRANAASGPIKARFQSIYCKVSQKRVVSPKYVDKACHSPYIQNGVEKSPLEIPRFPISLAFSHKELIGPF